MIPVLTVSQMRDLDKRAIGGDVAAGYSYMLRAGAGLFEAAAGLAPDKARGDIAVICGKGNNGGDGFVAARLLAEANYRVMCFGLCRPEEIRAEAKLAYDQYIARGGNYLMLDDVGDLGDLSRYSLIIDALLGSGLSGNPRGLAAEVIGAINESGVPVLAADTPSGLDNDRGVPGKPCIGAKVTVAMGFPKIGAFFHPGKATAGDYRIKDLGYPEECLEAVKPSLFLQEPRALAKMLPPRKQWGSKFDHGLLALICGSTGMTGSAILSSLAALRTGCGMAHLFSPKSALPALSSHLIEVVLHAVEETVAGTPAESGAEPIKKGAARMQAMCIGPGISHDEQTMRLVRDLLATVRLPVILDADGINAFKGIPERLKERAGELCITPHRGEWERLFPPLPDDPAGKVERLRETAILHSMTILYKGSPTIVADPAGRAFLLPYGNSGMATAGCGDVLTGCIGSLAAQGCTLPDAAVLGAYIHGRAGEIASERFGEYAMIASDLLTTIPDVLKNLVFR
jgi:ADP-dependent NAD(P)H-hydrate dehydratase / NAD(P)H-hydrate epimerase